MGRSEGDVFDQGCHARELLVQALSSNVLSQILFIVHTKNAAGNKECLGNTVIDKA